MSSEIQKMILNMDAVQDTFFEDAALIGLTTSLPGYQLCQSLNDAFCLQFEREPDLDVQIYNMDGSMRHYYPIYQCMLPLCNDRYLIYKLRHEGAFLLPELKNLDYLWLVQGLYPDQLAETFVHEIKRLPAIQRAQIIARNQLENLVMLLV